MRPFAAAVVGGLVLALTAPAQAANQVSSLAVSPASPIDLSENQTITVSGSATFDPPARTQVFTDKLGDDDVFAEATPPWQDLTAGFVEVDRAKKTLNLTWQVADLPNALGGIPETVRYLWEFSVTKPGGQPVKFQAQAKFTNVADRTGPQTTIGGVGKLSGRCTQTQNLITCEKIGEPPVVFDPVANEVTIFIPFSLLTSDGTPAGTPLMVEGARVAPEVIFRGIVAIVQAVLSSGAFGDVADTPPAVFTLGRHVRLGINPPDTPDDALDLPTHAIPAPDGSFSQELSLEGQIPGLAEVAAVACVDAACGTPTRVGVEFVE